MPAAVRRSVACRSPAAALIAAGRPEEAPGGTRPGPRAVPGPARIAVVERVSEPAPSLG
ncbi:hypothetical protein BOQ63_019850 [Streptomyces viridifaciens]|uniref:hypothetical protein n=1 Tax=Kitasatospora aureofaciens TaxID=1894 RepID=UPI000AF9D85B|nr:hypothetical protein [Kitasatospora aureofaciens]UKZ06260.1 hypothetical protein BOQ63_019850 [Streptomyces viridifaciens]